MLKRIRYCRNLFTLKKSGSLLFCNECNQVLGSINEFSHASIQLYTVCNCGSTGFLEYSETNTFFREPVNRIPDYVNGIYTCCKCRKPLFSINPNKTQNYTFYAVCSCGERYDTRVNHDKRLAETVRIIKAKRNKLYKH